MQKIEFQPFQKVLVRMVGNIWKADYFSHYEYKKEKSLVATSGYRFNSEEVLPYNNETKHLLGTNDNFKPDFTWGDHVEASDNPDFVPSAYGIFLGKEYNTYKVLVKAKDTETMLHYQCCRHSDW